MIVTTEEQRQQMKAYYEQNKEKRIEGMKRYWKNHNEQMKEYKQEYYQINKDYILARNKLDRIKHHERYKEYMKNYVKERKKIDVQFWMRMNLRDRVIKSFKQFSKTGKIKSSDEYGIDYDSIIKKLISELPADFDTKEYHIDHIQALCTFDLTDTEEVKKAFAVDNHQWLSKEDNLKKISQDIQLKNKKNKTNS
jgi:hypothetical protein